MRRYRKINESYEGFETWYNALRMAVRMHVQIFVFLLVVNLLCFAAGVYLVLGPFATRATAGWVAAKAAATVFPRATVVYRNPDGSRVRTTARALAENAAIRDFARAGLKRAGWIYLFSLGVFLLWPLVLGRFARRARAQADRQYIRGSRLITARQFTRRARKRKQALDLPFGSVRMPRKEEVKHTFIIGRPGSGKTQLLTPILQRLKQRGARAVVYDYKGDYVSRFFDPATDIIFNPLDKRSVGWNLFNEIKSRPDIDAISYSLIPPALSNSDPFWRDAARGVFAGILHYLHDQGLGTNEGIWRHVSADGEQIAACLKATPGGKAGYRYIENPRSRQALGVFAVMMQQARCFAYLAGHDGDFCINDWMQHGRGMIFITNYEMVQDTLRPMLSLFIDLLARRLLSMADDHRRRLFFLLDEFGTLQRLDALVKLLTGSRSKGGCVFLGIQDIGQLDVLYGRDLRKSIVNACGNAAIFAVGDPDNARFLSDKISDTEYSEMETSYSMGVEDFRDGTSLSQRKRKEPLFLPADIMRLPDMTAIVRFANHDHLISRFTYRSFADVNPRFELRDDLRMRASAVARDAEDAGRLDVCFEGV